MNETDTARDTLDVRRVERQLGVTMITYCSLFPIAPGLYCSFWFYTLQPPVWGRSDVGFAKKFNCELGHSGLRWMFMSGDAKSVTRYLMHKMSSLENSTSIADTLERCAFVNKIG